jgi:hypothetical protein
MHNTTPANSIRQPVQTNGTIKVLPSLASQGKATISKPLKIKARPQKIDSLAPQFVVLFVFMPINLDKFRDFENSFVIVRASPYNHRLSIRASTYVGHRIFKNIFNR